MLAALSATVARTAKIDSPNIERQALDAVLTAELKVSVTPARTG
ncbi:MAG: hypothetical protein ACI84D_003544 [Thalassolituus oleivorans]|jgi:hypothetical protein